MDLHKVWKLRLEGHNVDLFCDGEWTKFLVVEFLQRSNCFDMLLLETKLISNLKIWLIFVMDINIFLVSSLCILKLDTSCVWMFTNHSTQSLVVKFMMLCTPWMSNLGYKSWFAKKGVVMFMNALHCCTQTPSWTRSLTNYFDDDWLCSPNIVLGLNWHVMFAHPFGGGSLMIISSSHLIAQKLGCKLGSIIRNDIFKNAMILKNMIKKYFECLFASYCFIARNETNHPC